MFDPVPAFGAQLKIVVPVAVKIAQPPGQMVVLGDMSLGGSVTPVESIAECLQVAFDAGAKKVALPMSSAADIPTIPVELFTKFQTSFYADPVDAVFKGLGVD